MATSAPDSSYGRLHNRGSSGSSITTTTTSPALQNGPAFGFGPSLGSRRALYEEPLDSSRSAPPGIGAGVTTGGMKIKPYLRKLSLKEENARVDLSKSVAENEALAGLGIQDFSSVAGAPRSASDVSFVPVNSGRTRHQRATSNGSQFSTTSGSQRPSGPHMHPMRHTPRPYTPPIAKSYASPSFLGGSEGDGSDEATDVMVEDEIRYRIPQSGIYDPPLPTSSLRSESGTSSTVPSAPAPLHLHSSGSFTRIPSHPTPSQSSLTGSMPTTARTRSRGGTLQSFVSADTVASPISRTSMDKAFGLFRGKSNEDFDPAARAASIRAARQAYNEREEAKAAKAEREHSKRLDREQRKAGRREERMRRKSDATASRPERSGSLGVINTEKAAPDIMAFAAQGYGAVRSAHTNSLPEQVEKPPSRGAASQAVRFQRERDRRKGPRSTWLSFMAWFRKRLLGLSRAMHLSS